MTGSLSRCTAERAPQPGGARSMWETGGVAAIGCHPPHHTVAAGRRLQTSSRRVGIRLSFSIICDMSTSSVSFWAERSICAELRDTACQVPTFRGSRRQQHGGQKGGKKKVIREFLRCFGGGTGLLQLGAPGGLHVVGVQEAALDGRRHQPRHRLPQPAAPAPPPGSVRPPGPVCQTARPHPSPRRMLDLRPAGAGRAALFLGSRSQGVAARRRGTAVPQTWDTRAEPGGPSAAMPRRWRIGALRTTDYGLRSKTLGRCGDIVTWELNMPLPAAPQCLCISMI